METRRFRLEGASLPELQARVRTEHGDSARIVSAERVTVGGVRGFFARRHIEVTVEVQGPERDESRPDDSPGPDAATTRQRRRAAHARTELTTRLGIAALLDAADETELLLAGEAGGAAEPGSPGAPEPRPEATRRAPIDVPSTASPDFARLMDELTFATSAAPASPAASSTGKAGARLAPRSSADQMSEQASIPSEIPPAVTAGHPGLPVGAGDLVLLIGPGAEIIEAAGHLSAGRVAMILAGTERPHSRRAALAARARGVESGRSVLVACELPGGRDQPAFTGWAADLKALGADQVWVVVDAGRKTADTARWVRDVGDNLTVDAVAVVGIERTGTPGTVRQLALPIGWIAPAGAPASRPSTGRRAAARPPNPIAIG
ncbi:hypothetical protein [Cryobacterium sp. AP23]